MVILLSILIATNTTFFSIRLDRYVSLVIFGLGIVPIFTGYLFKINLRKMLPDIIFSIIDN
jgi:hypothetical protein